MFDKFHEEKNIQQNSIIYKASNGENITVVNNKTDKRHYVSLTVNINDSDA